METNQQVHEGFDPMHVGEPGDAAVGRFVQSTTSREPRFARPSVQRSDEERARRHRERTIAAWLRDLSR
jgi:hypothetical protein